jgi:SAM-dependent methyltransferase
MCATVATLPDLGTTTAKEVVRDALTRRCGDLAGRRILDVGTGTGAMARWLRREGAEAFGLEPNAGLLRAAVADPKRPAPAGAWLAASAERLPLRRASFDAVLFFNSLHHIAPDRQVAALAEAARCLRPLGDLVVIEPVAAGSFFQLLAPLDDETRVRAAAQAALAAVRGRLFAALDEARFTTSLAFPHPEAVVASLTRADRTREADVRQVMPLITKRFQALGIPQPDGGRRFLQPMTRHHFRGILSSA